MKFWGAMLFKGTIYKGVDRRRGTPSDTVVSGAIKAENQSHPFIFRVWRRKQKGGTEADLWRNVIFGDAQINPVGKE